MIGYNNRLPQTNSENIQKQKHHHITERPFDSLIYSLLTTHWWHLGPTPSPRWWLRSTSFATLGWAQQRGGGGATGILLCNILVLHCYKLQAKHHVSQCQFLHVLATGWWAQGSRTCSTPTPTPWGSARPLRWEKVRKIAQNNHTFVNFSPTRNFKCYFCPNHLFISRIVIFCVC